MQVVETGLSEVLVLAPRVFEDARGYLFESYRRSALAELQVRAEFVQENQSRSVRHVLRGMHYQIRQAQGKLVRVVAGEIFDAVVDLRRSSPTFTQWFGTRLSDENRRMLWVPPGFAHGFLVLSEYADVLYKTTDYYAPQHERSLLWNDPDVGIRWPINGEPIVSSRDAKGSRLGHAEYFP